jgi:MFS family permease
VAARNPAVPIYLLVSGATAGLFALVTTLNLVYQATVVGLSPLQLVLVGTMLEAVIFVAEVPTGVVADLYSRRRSILIGLVLLGGGWILEGSVPAFGAVLGAQVLWGVGYTFTSGATDAWLTDEVSADTDDAGVALIFVRGTKAAQVGTVAGIVGAGLLGLVWLRLPIILGGVGYVVLAAVLLGVMPENHFRPAGSGERARFAALAQQFAAGLALARRRKLVRSLLLVSLIGGLASEAFDRLWTVHVLDSFTLPGVAGGSGEVIWFTAIGLVGTLLSLGVTALMARVSPRTLTSLHPRGLMAGLAAVQVIAVGIFAIAGQLVVAVAMLWLRTIATVLASPVNSAWLNRNLEPEVRATVLSMESQLGAAGQVVGGPILGWVGSAFSVRAALLGSALTLAPVIGVYARAPSGSADRTPARLDPATEGEA